MPIAGQPADHFRIPKQLAMYPRARVWCRLLISCRRHTSAVGIPASCSFSIAMICSSLNLLRFILSVRILRVGLYSKSVTFQGSTPISLWLRSTKIDKVYSRTVPPAFDRETGNPMARSALAIYAEALRLTICRVKRNS